VKPAGTLRFSHYDQLIQAAIGGQGIALGRSRFVAKWVKLGKLILPFGKRYMRSPSDSRAYFMVLPRGSLARPGVAEFSSWLQQQAQAEEADSVLKDSVREERDTHGRR
jgi:DNA-binding transcriptional LysR family regulator